MSETTAVTHNPPLDLPVQFGGVSIGKSTGRIAVRVDRSLMKGSDADDIFCYRRLSGKVVLGHHDDAPGQTKLFADVDHYVEGAFDVKGFRVTLDTYSTGLSFNLQDIDIDEMAKLSSGAGRIVFDAVAEIPEQDQGEAATFVPGELKFEGAWQHFPLDQLFDPKQTIYKALAEAKITTMGDLATYSNSGQLLTDIPGIGAGKAQQIEDANLAFFQDNPDADDVADDSDLDPDFD